MNRKKKYWVGSIIILVAFSVLVFQGLNRSMMSYLNVRELGQGQPAQRTSVVQVTGIVEPGTFQKASDGREMQFFLQDLETPEARVLVKYRGIVPDNFKPGIQIVAQGSFNDQQRVFQAEQLFVKCPSKYEAN